MTKEEKKTAFKNILNGYIISCCTECTQNNGSISYAEGQAIISKIDMKFLKNIGFVPKQITAAENLALAFIAPSLKEKKKLIKNFVSITLGICGLAAIIIGIALALGWGKGIWDSIKNWFNGTSIWGPIIWIFAGTSLTVIAGYFYFYIDDAKIAELFEKVLINGLNKAIDEIWEKHGEFLYNAMNGILPTKKD